MRIEHLHIKASIPNLSPILGAAWHWTVDRIWQAIEDAVAPRQSRRPQERDTWPNWFYAWFNWERVWPQDPNR